jgi:hypothetical protein
VLHTDLVGSAVSMTRRDYTLVADALLYSRPRDREDLRSWRQWEATADRIAWTLQHAYANFDLEKFQVHIHRKDTPG